MSLKAFFKRFLILVFKHGFIASLLDRRKISRDGLNEAEIETKIDILNKAAEEYFVTHKENLGEELRKPFIVSEQTPLYLMKMAFILSEMTMQKGLTVLDFGCGTGWLSNYFNMLGFNVIGLDVSETALDFARKNIKNQKFYDKKHNYFFLLYGGERFPLPDSSVHYIVTYDAFHHVPSQQRALDEMHRVLVPGGKVMLSEPGEGHSQSEDTLAEVEKYGVLERDVCILDIESRATSAGFQNIYMKPFLANISKNLSAIDYHRLLKGKSNLTLLQDIRDTLISNPFFILEKEGDLESSFALSGAISSDTTIIKCKPGSKIAFSFSLKNNGTKAYPHIEHGNGGFVTIGKKLLLNGKIVDDNYGKRTILTNGIAPGESVDLKIKLTAPKKNGKYQLIVEPVLELFYWFSEKGCEPLKIDIIVE